MSSRESARREWRANVARAAEAWRVAEKHTHYGATIVRHLDDAAGRGVELTWKHRADLDAALSAPKPWARPRPGADLGKCACLRRGRECGYYCRLDGTCPECWNDRRGVRPHNDDGEGEGDECPTAASYSIGDTGDFFWACRCAFRKCPRRCGGTPPKAARARLRRKRRAAQRRRR